MKDHSIKGYLDRLTVEDLQIALMYYQNCRYSEENEEMIKRILEKIKERGTCNRKETVENRG